MIIDDLTESNDLFRKGIPGYQDLEADNSQLQGQNLRKTRLTLLQINKMRQMHDVRNFEQKQKVQSIRSQYGSAEGEEGGDDLGF